MIDESNSAMAESIGGCQHAGHLVVDEKIPESKARNLQK